MAPPATARAWSQAAADAPLTRALSRAVLQRDPHAWGPQQKKHYARPGAATGPTAYDTPAPQVAGRVRRDRALYDLPPLMQQLDVLHEELGLYSSSALASNRAKVRFKAVASLAMTGVNIGTAGASAPVTASLGVMLEMIETEDHAPSALVSQPFVSAQQARVLPAPRPSHAAPAADPWSTAGYGAKAIDLGLKAVEMPAHVPGASQTLGIVKNLLTLHKSGRPFVLDAGNLEFVRAAMRELKQTAGTLAAKQSQLASLGDPAVAPVVGYLRFEQSAIHGRLTDLQGLVARSAASAGDGPAAPAPDPTRERPRRGAVFFPPVPATRPRR